MPHLSDSTNIASIQLKQQTVSPSTPTSGFWQLYAKSDGVYIVNSLGTELGPLSVGSAGSASSAMATGTYTGNGNVTQSITGLGFSPKYLYIASNLTSNTAIYYSSLPAGYSIVSGSIYHQNSVVSRDTDGFTVGQGGSIDQFYDFNSNNRIYYYLSMG